MLNVEPSNFIFFRTFYAEFDEIIITFMDQNGRPLEIEDKVNLKLLTMRQYSIEPRTRKYFKDINFYHLRAIFITNTTNNCWKENYNL